MLNRCRFVESTCGGDDLEASSSRRVGAAPSLHWTCDDTVECIVGTYKRRIEIHRMFTLLDLCYIHNRIVRRIEEEVGLSRDVNEANRLEAMAMTLKAKASTFKPRGQDRG